MRRREFLGSTAATAAGLPQGAAQPNIVFFMLDQIAMKRLEGDARKSIPTPNFDRSQQRDVTFPRAFSINPVCCPARATLATGLTTRGHGELLLHLREDPDEQRNLARESSAARVRAEMRDRLLEAVIAQDYPHTQNNRYSLGVH